MHYILSFSCQFLFLTNSDPNDSIMHVTSKIYNPDCTFTFSLHRSLMMIMLVKMMMKVESNGDTAVILMMYSVCWSSGARQWCSSHSMAPELKESPLNKQLKGANEGAWVLGAGWADPASQPAGAQPHTLSQPEPAPDHTDQWPDCSGQT